MTLADDWSPSLSVALIINVYISFVSLSNAALLRTTILLVLGWNPNIEERDDVNVTLLGTEREREREIK